MVSDLIAIKEGWLRLTEDILKNEDVSNKRPIATAIGLQMWFLIHLVTYFHSPFGHHLT